MRPFKFVLRDYGDGWYWFEAVDMLRRFALTTFPRFVYRGTAFQRAFVCCLSVVFLALQVRFQPYRTRTSNLLKSAVDVNVLLAICVATIIKSEDGSSNPIEPVTPDTYALCLKLFTAAVYAAAVVDIAYRVHKKGKFNASLISMSENVGVFSGTFSTAEVSEPTYNPAAASADEAR